MESFVKLAIMSCLLLPGVRCTEARNSDRNCACFMSRSYKNGEETKSRERQVKNKKKNERRR